MGGPNLLWSLDDVSPSFLVVPFLALQSDYFSSLQLSALSNSIVNSLLLSLMFQFSTILFYSAYSVVPVMCWLSLVRKLYLVVYTTTGCFA